MPSLNLWRKYLQAGEGESHKEVGELSLRSPHEDPPGPGLARDTETAYRFQKSES